MPPTIICGKRVNSVGKRLALLRLNSIAKSGSVSNRKQAGQLAPPITETQIGNSEMKTEQELIAEFLANKGATKIPAGERAYNPRDIYNARRNGGKAMAESDRAERHAESMAESMADTAREAQLNGQRVTGYDSAGNIYTERGRY
jgi:hypothetical protein